MQVKGRKGREDSNNKYINKRLANARARDWGGRNRSEHCQTNKKKSFRRPFNVENETWLCE